MLHRFWVGQSGGLYNSLYTIAGILLFIALAIFVVLMFRRLRQELFRNRAGANTGKMPPDGRSAWMVNSTDDAIVSGEKQAEKQLADSEKNTKTSSKTVRCLCG